MEIVDMDHVAIRVSDLDRALDFYQALGFEVTDRGDERKRVRLTTGEFDLELWEPHLGLADARGGVHVDFGVSTPNPENIADTVREEALAVESVPNGVRIRDPDGHYLSLVS